LQGTAKPQIVVDALGNMHLVFEAGYGGDLGQLTDPSTVMYAASYDHGASWTNPIRLSPQRGDTPNAQARNVALAVDGSQKLLAVWWAIPEDVIYYQISADQGRTWSSPSPIPSVAGIWSVYQSRLDDFTMATDSAGHVHLVLAGRPTPSATNVNLFHLVWDGSAWSRPDTIATYQGDVPEWPRLAIGNGNQLHLAWFVRDGANLYTSDTSNFRVWYAHAEADAPAIAPVADVVPTATPSAVVDASTQESAPVTLSTFSLDGKLKLPSSQEVSLSSLKTENDDVGLLAMSLLPTLILVGGISLVIARRKQT
jgi:hypothetical protein